VIDNVLVIYPHQKDLINTNELDVSDINFIPLKADGDSLLSEGYLNLKHHINLMVSNYIT